jgi:hypothetical protein
MGTDGCIYVNTNEGIAKIRALASSEIAAINAKYPPVQNSLVTTIAGTPAQSGFPTIGPARTTLFRMPSDIAIDKRNGDIYVADRGNSCIRKMYLNADGTYSITHFVGSTAATQGNTNGFREKVRINGPSSLLLVGDTLYFAEVGIWLGIIPPIFIKKADIKTGEVTTIVPLAWGADAIMAL